MTDEARRRQAQLQASLLRSLTRTGPPQTGMDVARVDLAATSLARKRARSVAQAWRGLAEALGPRFDAEFAAFAATTPIPSRGGPLADGMAFSCWLSRKEPLPSAARLEQLAVSLRFRPCRGGLESRRCPALQGAWIPGLRRLVLVVRWWPGCESWLHLPLPILPVGSGIESTTTG